MSMSFRYTLAKSLIAICLLSGTALAESPKSRDHLSYYTYYKTKTGETVSAVATKFGLHQRSLVKMNPQLTQYDGNLPAGTLICVPKETEIEVSEPVASKPPAGRVEKTKKKRKKRRSRKKRKQREEPSEAEWEKLAELATKNAPKAAAPRPRRAAAKSRFVGANGRVVWVPAARPKPEPKPKRDKRRKRVKLSSRKGKAIHEVLTTCRSYMGTPYVWGGEQPGGFDCSGYVQYAFAKHGYKLPRTADIQFNVGEVVKRGKEKPGDLVFFETYAPGASHVGVYLGRGYFIHASSSRGVTVERLATDFFAQRYLGARRTKF